MHRSRRRSWSWLKERRKWQAGLLTAAGSRYIEEGQAKTSVSAEDVAGGGIDAERSVTRPLMRAGVLERKREGGGVLGVFRLGGAAGWALW